MGVELDDKAGPRTSGLSCPDEVEMGGMRKNLAFWHMEQSRMHEVDLRVKRW
jgi:hypothetical protein